MEPSDVELSQWAMERCRRTGITPERIRADRAMAVDLDEFDRFKIVEGPLRQDGTRLVFTCFPEDHVVHEFGLLPKPPTYRESTPAW